LLPHTRAVAENAGAQLLARGERLSNIAFQSSATDSVLFAGPVHGRKLAVDDVKSVLTVITSNPAIEKLGSETIAFASGAVGC
jgi:hypothetical protein